MVPFGLTLYLWRRARGLTQDELARRAKVPRPNLSAIERGKRQVTLTTVRVLAAALGVRAGALVDGVPPRAAEGHRLSLSRKTIERLADAVAFGRTIADPDEQEVVAALRTLLEHRTRAIHRRWSRPRVGRRAAISAWVLLTSCYGRQTIQSLADRIAQRQRVYGFPND